MLYGCVAWSPRACHYDTLRRAHHMFLTRCNLGGDVNHNVDLSIEVNRGISKERCSFWEYTLELYDRPSAPAELKIRMLSAEILKTVLYGCVTWSPRACHYDTLRRAHHVALTHYIGWRKNNCSDYQISYLKTHIKTGSESI